MPTVLALIYPERDIPIEVYDEIRELQNDEMLQLIDVCEVETKDNGKIKMEHPIHLPLIGSSNGFFLSAFVGLLYFRPKEDISEAVAHFLEDINFDKKFIEELHNEVPPRNSVLFLYLKDEVTDEVQARLMEHGGRTLEAKLDDEQEEKLHNLFHKQKSEVLAETQRI